MTICARLCTAFNALMEVAMKSDSERSTRRRGLADRRSSLPTLLIAVLGFGCNGDKEGVDDTADVDTIAGPWGGYCAAGDYLAGLDCIITVEDYGAIGGDASATIFTLDWRGTIEGTVEDDKVDAVLSLQGGGNFLDISVSATWDKDRIEGRCAFVNWSTEGEIILVRTE